MGCVQSQRAPLDSPAISRQSNAERSRSRWQTVVHNDPVNLMSYVQWVFETYFSMAPQVAYRKMLEVHHTGRAVVSAGQREQMERDAQAMHSYGLQATIEECEC